MTNTQIATIAIVVLSTAGCENEKQEPTRVEIDVPADANDDEEATEVEVTAKESPSAASVTVRTGGSAAPVEVKAGPNGGSVKAGDTSVENGKVKAGGVEVGPNGIKVPGL